jgi:hypothetical protein
LKPIFIPTEQANPTTVFKENTAKKNVAMIRMDRFVFNLFTAVFFSDKKYSEHLYPRIVKIRFTRHQTKVKGI